MDIKAWLEQAGEPVAEVAFRPGKAPKSYPYITFLDHVERSGGDMLNLEKRHSLTVERYSDTADDNMTLEELFDAKAVKHTKEKQWLSDDQCYMTTYDFETILIEREDI